MPDSYAGHSVRSIVEVWEAMTPEQQAEALRKTDESNTGRLFKRSASALGVRLYDEELAEQIFHFRYVDNVHRAIEESKGA